MSAPSGTDLSSCPASPSVKRPSLLRMLSHSTSVAKRAQQSGGETNEEMVVLLRDLPTPAFVINRHAFTLNCQRVLDLCSERKLKLRPHVKTHKTLEGTRLQAQPYAQHAHTHTHTLTTSPLTGFVASTLPEVKLLVNYYTRRSNCPSGSILYGVPISETKLPALFSLQERLVNWHNQQSFSNSTTTTTTITSSSKPTQIMLLMDHPRQIQMVNAFLQQQQNLDTSSTTTTNTSTNTSTFQFPVMVKLDTGYHRAGTTCDQNGLQLVEAIVKAPFLNLIGLYSHCGHAYDEQDQSKLHHIANADMAVIQAFLKLIEEHLDDHQKQQIFGTNFTISVGSTPSLPHHFHPSPNNNNPQQEWWTQFFLRYPTAILEVHPGNYTLYDRQQIYTNACPNVQAIAGRVLTRVIGHYNDTHRPNTILMDAGATALTKESTPQGGMAAITGHEQSSTVYKMSQEVSMARGNSPQFLQDCPLGALLALQPNHSCLAAACFDKYYIIDDPTGLFAPDAPIVDEWEPVKGW